MGKVSLLLVFEVEKKNVWLQGQERGINSFDKGGSGS